VQSLVAEGPITTVSNVKNYAMPYVETETGANRNEVNLRWPSALKGTVHVTMRCDNPN
jgi:hypothetical protein